MQEIVVIGSGITGLATAYYLEEAGYSCKLITGRSEVRKKPIGGVINTEFCEFEQNIFRLESGPNVILLKPELKELVEKLNLNDQLIYPTIYPYAQAIYANGQVIDVPKSFLALVKFPLLTLLQKIKLLLKLFRVGLLNNQEEDLSIAKFLEPLLGQRLVNQIVNPVFQGIYGGNIELLSARSVMPRFWSAAKAGASIFQFMRSKGKSPKVVLLNGGMQQIIDQLKDKLQRTEFVNDSVKDLEYLDGQYQIYLNTGEKLIAKALFIASHAKDNQSFLSKLSDAYVSAAKNIKYVPMIVAHFCAPKENFKYPKHFGVLYPAAMKSGVLGVMFNSVIFPEVVNGNQHLLTVCLAGGENHGLLEESEQEIFNRAASEIESSLKIGNVKPIKITKIPNAIVQYQVGHHKFLEIVEQIEKDYSNLFLCGWETGGIGVPDRVAAAKLVVEKFLKSK